VHGCVSLCHLVYHLRRFGHDSYQDEILGLGVGGTKVLQNFSDNSSVSTCVLCLQNNDCCCKTRCKSTAMSRGTAESLHNMHITYFPPFCRFRKMISLVAKLSYDHLQMNLIRGQQFNNARYRAAKCNGRNGEIMRELTIYLCSCEPPSERSQWLQFQFF
jgi:hypothetical protein